jgi:phosphohistidine phosphatase
MSTGASTRWHDPVLPETGHLGCLLHPCSESCERNGAVNGHPAQRRLVLVRHAKASWPHGVPDRNRPLSGRGRRNAQAAGEWFLREGPLPEIVLCSDAVRALQTWEIIAEALPSAPELRHVPELYLAESKDLLRAVRRLDEGVQVAAVVGHEPTMSSTALMLAGRGSSPADVNRIVTKYPTSAVAVLRFDGPWTSLSAGLAALESFSVPRAAKSDQQ